MNNSFVQLKEINNVEKNISLNFVHQIFANN